MPKKTAKRKRDLVLAVGQTDDGKGVHVLRSRTNHLEVGEMRPLEEGRPIQGEVVKLEPRPELPVLFDAETVVEAPKSTPRETAGTGHRHGPAQVASDTYRKNWDAIWRRSTRRRELN